MKKLIFITAIIILGMTSCEEYLDINTDPNTPSSDIVSSDMILPGAEMNLATSYGDFLRIVGGYFAQQYSQDFGTSNYIDYSSFIVSPTRSSGTYTQLYTRALNNLESIRNKAMEAEEWGTYLAATSLRVFTFQVLVDAYGEVPYTESLQVEITSPAYDDGDVVYAGILAELEDALAQASAADYVSANFLFGTNTAEEWIQFANALKLKLLMRVSDVQDVQAKLAALIAEDNFPTEDVSWDDCWTDEKGKASPFYQEEYATYFGSTQINVAANIAYMSALTSVDDARLSKFWEVNEADSSYTGGVSGTNFSTSTTYQSSYFCRPVFAYDMPVYLISVSEIEFFLAEYNARYGTAADAKAHYEAAIDASFTSAGLTAADAAPIYTTHYPYVQADYKELIGIQKWVALGGTNNFEAWCEMRRLGYPEFGSVSGDDIYNEATDTYDLTIVEAGKLYTPIDVNTELGDNKLIQRFKYSESSSSRNSNTPVNVKGDVPVFWAE